MKHAKTKIKELPKFKSLKLGTSNAGKLSQVCLFNKPEQKMKVRAKAEIQKLKASNGAETAGELTHLHLELGTGKQSGPKISNFDLESGN